MGRDQVRLSRKIFLTGVIAGSLASAGCVSYGEFAPGVSTMSEVRSKSGRPMFLRLSDEFMAAYRREGEAMTKRENTTKMAESNKAFAHFAW